jgi:hypothetical protein
VAHITRENTEQRRQIIALNTELKTIRDENEALRAKLLAAASSEDESQEATHQTTPSQAATRQATTSRAATNQALTSQSTTDQSTPSHVSASQSHVQQSSSPVAPAAVQSRASIMGGHPGFVPIISNESGTIPSEAASLVTNFVSIQQQLDFVRANSAAQIQQLLTSLLAPQTPQQESQPQLRIHAQPEQQQQQHQPFSIGQWQQSQFLQQQMSQLQVRQPQSQLQISQQTPIQEQLELLQNLLKQSKRSGNT